MRPLKILLSAVVLLSVAFLARAEGRPTAPRTALIIGNADYSFAPLKNPINEADPMAMALEGAGFKVIKETNADQAKMVEAVRAFGTELKQRAASAVLFSGTDRSTARTTFCRSAASFRAWRTSSAAGKYVLIGSTQVAADGETITGQRPVSRP